MKKFLIVTFMALIFTVSQAEASIMSYNFTFSGGGATAVGTISFDMAILTAPGRYLYDPAGAHTEYGSTAGNFVTALTITVSGGSSPGNGTFSLSNFDSVLFDTGGLNFNQTIFGQVLAGGGTWGDPSTLGASNPVASLYGGDFQLFSSELAPPSGNGPFELVSGGGDSMLLTSFSPATATPEPGTMMLLGSGVLAFALSRYRRRKENIA